MTSPVETCVVERARNPVRHSIMVGLEGRLAPRDVEAEVVPCQSSHAASRKGVVSEREGDPEVQRRAVKEVVTKRGM